MATTTKPKQRRKQTTTDQQKGKDHQQRNYALIHQWADTVRTLNDFHTKLSRLLTSLEAYPRGVPLIDPLWDTVEDVLPGMIACLRLTECLAGNMTADTPYVVDAFTTDYEPGEPLPSRLAELVAQYQ